MKEFAVSFISWVETHHEICTLLATKTKFPEWVMKHPDFNGIRNLSWLTLKLTDEFEEQYKEIQWGVELEYFDTIEEFLKEKL